MLKGTRSAGRKKPAEAGSMWAVERLQLDGSSDCETGQEMRVQLPPTEHSILEGELADSPSLFSYDNREGCQPQLLATMANGGGGMTNDEKARMQMYMRFAAIEETFPFGRHGQRRAFG